jgi:DNA-binding NtrC family response regulator/tetratricopeptide (TPR) repeat protein
MEDPLTQLLGESHAMVAVRDQVRRLLQRQSDSRRLPSVLLQGETGTGKGLLARAIHAASLRAAGPFIDVSCAAIPETLLEAEMFGVERGAFTDARQSRPGLFQLAHNGTIFLDEIGLMSETLQSKLLKVIEERVVRRLGSTRSTPVNVWVIAATNEDLMAAMRTGRFRADLYHRLAVVTLALPPVRDRGEDVLLLADHFLARACTDYGLPTKTLTPAARAAIRAYLWPGNVRELSNVTERVALLSEATLVTPEILGLSGLAAVEPQVARPAASTLQVAVDEVERQRLLEALTKTDWNITRAAEQLGISRNTLRYRIEKHGLRRETGPAGRKPTTHDGELPAVAEPARVEEPTLLYRERRRLMLLRAALVTRPGSSSLLPSRRVLELLSDKVASFGGRVEELSADGLVAMFGLEPVEDAPLRAALAAMAILNGVERLSREGQTSVSVTIAIHSDQFPVLQAPDASPIGLEAREQLWAFLSSLVSALPPNSVGVSEAALPFLERRFDLVPGSLLDSAPGHVWRVTGRSQTGFGPGGRMGTFVGRHDEMELLRSRSKLAAYGQGQIVGIAGEAGIGKSRLLFEFRWDFAGRPATFLEGRCFSFGQVIPYLPVLDLVRALCGVVDADPPEAVADKVKATLASVGLESSEAAQDLLYLLGLGDGAARLAGRSPEEIKAWIFDALNECLLRTSARQPLVVLIEDLHWIDTASEDFLATLAERLPGARILLVTTYRAGYRARWIDRSYATQIALQPLNREHAESVVRAILGPGDVGDALVEQILVKGEGNPFFLEELARAVSEQGGRTAEFAVPDTVQEVLLARIDRLPSAAKGLLQTAAVIGKDVPFALLREVAGLEEAELRPPMGSLKAAEFLVETSEGLEIRYSFKHALTHEVAYQALTPERRRGLHARIVAAIEALYPDRLAVHTERLAHHAFRGEVWDRAAQYLLRSGRRALFTSATGEAVEVFERALLALRRLPQTPETLRRAVALRLNLRDALWSLGRIGRIRDQLFEAEALAQQLGDQRELGRVACYLCHYFWAVGELVPALEAGQRALTIASQSGDSLLLAEIQLYRGLVFLAQGEHQHAVHVLQRTLLDLDRLIPEQPTGARRPVAIALLVRCFLARALAELGRFEEGIACGEEAIRLAEVNSTAFGRVTALVGLGFLHLRREEPEITIRLVDWALELCRTYSVNNWLPTVGAALGAAHVGTGRVEEGLRYLEEAVALGQRMGLTASLSLWRMHLGEAYLSAGRLSEAFAQTRLALSECRARMERGYEAWLLHLLGRIAASQQPPDTQEARRSYLSALELAEKLGMRPLLARCALGLAQLAERVGDVAAASVYRERASRLAAELGIRLA